MYCLRLCVTMSFVLSREWSPVGRVTWFPVLTPGAHAFSNSGGRVTGLGRVEGPAVPRIRELLVNALFFNCELGHINLLSHFILYYKLL